jgi:predicted CXXCH cytochrome family protein
VFGPGQFGLSQVNAAPIDPIIIGGTKADSREPTLVGRQVCGECHVENYALHAKHGHASTFHLVSETDLADTFSGASFDAGKSFGTYEYQADERGGLTAMLPARFGKEHFPLQYALGSGLQAQTMLTLTTGVDGKTEGIEHRASFYSGNRIGLTPGHSKKNPHSALEYFGDVMQGEPLERCIYCHTTSGKVVGEGIIDLVANVNCEKCHGPGSEHVRLARASSKPPHYSVGQETWDTESEIQLCGDCHRLPQSSTEKEIREYPDHLAKFQPIGMLRSRCYLESEGQMKCTTCHNPHTTIAQSQTSDFVRICIDCHDETKNDHEICSVSKTIGCIECHMPIIEMDEGLKFHDHWIRVLKEGT